MISMRLCGILARQELRAALRNRWVVVYAAIFTILTSAVSYFGLTIIEFTGFQGFERTAASLLNLVLYIVPLAAMLMTVQAFSVDGGLTSALLAEPVTRTEIVCGKLLGVFGALALATLIGFGLPGIIIARHTGAAGLSSYLTLVGYCLVAAACFCAIASCLTMLSQRTPRAYGVVLVVWFVMVLLFDLGVIGLSFLLPEGTANRLSYVSLFLNPVDGVRVSTLLATVGKEAFGVAGVMLVRALGGIPSALTALGASLLLWIAIPTAMSSVLLSRQDT